MAERKYVWKDTITGKIVEIYRPLDFYHLCPDVTEATEQGLTLSEYDNSKWERLIQPPLVINKWPSTTGSVKGKH